MDRAQFSQLAAHEQELLRRLLLALCLGDKALADDLAQETLVKAFLSCAAYRDEGRFTAWVYRIAWHTFIDHKRNLRRTERLEEAQGMAGERRADEGLQYEDLYSALGQLPEKERTALLLFYMKGYSAKEISDIMECGEDAVRKQLQRGREHLRTKLDNNGRER